jgi:hypothetical protein
MTTPCSDPWCQRIESLLRCAHVYIVYERGATAQYVVIATDKTPNCETRKAHGQTLPAALEGLNEFVQQSGDETAIGQWPFSFSERRAALCSKHPGSRYQVRTMLDPATGAMAYQHQFTWGDEDWSSGIYATEAMAYCDIRGQMLQRPVTEVTEVAESEA